MSEPWNVLVAGTGGRGVYTLTRALWLACAAAGLRCLGSTHKGGAQTLGSIHSVLRIFQGGDPRAVRYSTQIPEGDLDVALGLEPWETLRHQALFGARTRLFVNGREERLLVERYRGSPLPDPLRALEALGLPLTVRDYAAQADRTLGTPRMANFLVACDAARAGALPFDGSAVAAAFREELALDGEAARRLAHEGERPPAPATC